MLNYLEYRKYSNKFEQLLMSDVHNDIDGYIVRSLYFDMIENKAFYLIYALFGALLSVISFLAYKHILER